MATASGALASYYRLNMKRVLAKIISKRSTCDLIFSLGGARLNLVSTQK